MMPRRQRAWWLWPLLPFVAAAAEPGSDAWQVMEAGAAQVLPEGCGTLRRLRCTQGAGGAGAAITVVVFNAGRYRVRIIDQPSGFPLGARPVARTLAEERVTDPAAVVAINGGYFARDFRSDGLDFRPDGLFRLAGVEQFPLSEKAVLSGILAVDGHGRAALLPRQADVAGYPAAFQTGPFVVDPGGLPGVKTPGPVARRTVIATTDDERILVLVTAPLPLVAVSSLLVGHAADFGVTRVERALNLDGGPSTGLAAQTTDGQVLLPELGPVRNVVLFSAQAAGP